jgi:hypothetical protein
MTHIASLLHLPDELIVDILSSLDSVRSLPAVRITCRKIYALSQDLIQPLLSREIQSPLLPYALAVHEARDLAHSADEVAHTLIQSLRDGFPSTQLPTTNIVHAIKMSRLHNVVMRFADEFAESALKRLPGEQSGRKISARERHRFCRALYRAELYYAMFTAPYCDEDNEGYPSSIPRNMTAAGEQRRELFFKPYAPWLNEQLGCVHDFLHIKLLKSGLIDVAAHDVYFGLWWVDYQSHYEQKFWVQFFVSLAAVAVIFD